MIFKNFFRKPKPCTDLRSIFIGQIGGVGDLVCSAPSIEALKKKYPKATIVFGVGDSIFYETIKNNPRVDRFETPFFYNVWKKKERRKIEREKLKTSDQVILLDNPDRDWWKHGKHLIDIYAEKCGVELENRRPVMYLTNEDDSVAEKLIRDLEIGKGKKLLVLAPEVRSKKEMKEWPHDRVLALIEKIRQHHKARIITFVSKDNTQDYPGTNVVQGFPIGPSAAVIRLADLYIGLDNGMTHIAACFDVKMISIHIGYPRECCEPLSPFAVTIAHEPFCSPNSISVEEVYRQVDMMLGNNGLI